MDKPLPNDEAALLAVVGRLTAHGRVQVVVDQDATSSALPLAAARSPGIGLGPLPGRGRAAGDPQIGSEAFTVAPGVDSNRSTACRRNSSE